MADGGVCTNEIPHGRKAGDRKERDRLAPFITILSIVTPQGHNRATV